MDALWRSDHLDKPTKEENEEYQVDNEVGELKKTYATDLEGDLAGIAKESQRFAEYLPALYSMRQEKRHKIRKLVVQETKRSLKEVIQWIVEG